jgi:hypothetical protein
MRPAVTAALIAGFLFAAVAAAVALVSVWGDVAGPHGVSEAERRLAAGDYDGAEHHAKGLDRHTAAYVVGHVHMHRARFAAAAAEFTTFIETSQTDGGRAQGLILRARARLGEATAAYVGAVGWQRPDSAARAAAAITQVQLDVAEAKRLDPATAAEGDAILAEWDNLRR